ncbi:hypothetical protein MTR67_045118 [Solanum verrucosum]|uniref:Uncharacterized protein n=1 Tax=Solanum verrucosum TaxID=315347 RepID=A0AAF0UUS1_SOLVR|nr:hypothetical protein MTR67_045118 [Solanum verrucosum]
MHTKRRVIYQQSRETPGAEKEKERNLVIQCDQQAKVGGRKLTSQKAGTYRRCVSLAPFEDLAMEGHRRGHWSQKGAHLEMEGRRYLHDTKEKHDENEEAVNIVILESERKVVDVFRQEIFNYSLCNDLMLLGPTFFRHVD